MLSGDGLRVSGERRHGGTPCQERSWSRDGGTSALIKYPETRNPLWRSMGTAVGERAKETAGAGRRRHDQSWLGSSVRAFGTDLCPRPGGRAYGKGFFSQPCRGGSGWRPRRTSRKQRHDVFRPRPAGRSYAQSNLPGNSATRPRHRGVPVVSLVRGRTWRSFWPAGQYASGSTIRRPAHARMTKAVIANSRRRLWILVMGGL